MGAYKSVDIDQGLMRDEILAIRKHKWTTMSTWIPPYPSIRSWPGNIAPL